MPNSSVSVTRSRPRCEVLVSSREAYSTLKRVADVVIAGAVLLVLAPVIVAVAVAVAIALGSPVFFRQIRAGRGGEPFSILKFRTMLDVDEARGLVTDEQRLTAFGAFLRSTSLDELPGLVNVIRGEMSIVGPRPLPLAYLPHYTETERRRLDVRPGVTGLAQIRGRNAAGWDERLRWDVEYVDGLGLRRDVAIALGTVSVVLRRSGISADGHVTCASLIDHRSSGTAGATGAPLTGALATV